MKLTPDGGRYIALGQGKPVPQPFNLRWLIPWLCKDKPRRWQTCAWASAVLACAGVVVLARQHHVSWWPSITAGLFVAGLPSMKFQLSRPVLVDLPSLAVSVWCAVLVPVFWPAAIVLALFAGCVRETAPVWAAVYAWNPLPLSGLVVVAVRALLAPSGPDVLDERNAWILQHPVRASLEFHKWRDPFAMVLPWGGLLAALWFPSAWLVVALLLAYSQLAVATDTVRLYQQAAPVLAVVVVTHVAWLLPLLVVHWFNPFSGDGV